MHGIYRLICMSIYAMEYMSLLEYEYRSIALHGMHGYKGCSQQNLSGQVEIMITGFNL